MNTAYKKRMTRVIRRLSGGTLPDAEKLADMLIQDKEAVILLSEALGIDVPYKEKHLTESRMKKLLHEWPHAPGGDDNPAFDNSNARYFCRRLRKDPSPETLAKMKRVLKRKTAV